jgi:hypothetical protein
MLPRVLDIYFVVGIFCLVYMQCADILRFIIIFQFQYVEYAFVVNRIHTVLRTILSSLGRYVFGSEISYNKPPPRLPGLGC